MTEFNAQLALLAISPIDGRYATQTEPLQLFFSEFALIRYRYLVEIRYLKALGILNLKNLGKHSQELYQFLERCEENFSMHDALRIKELERTTNHDVKAVEYFIREQLSQSGFTTCFEFVHFGLTSQDINNTAIPMSIKDGFNQILIPQLIAVIDLMRSYAQAWKTIPMLSRTHGQPASPTSLGKEIQVFVERLELQLVKLNNYQFSGKFGGATGNLNAHIIAYPDVDWKQFADTFLQKDLGLQRQQTTTQIAHYDELAELFHICIRIHTIFIDFCRDFWQYISLDYFKQTVLPGEVGSSAMPHKVNPIDFENAEGNLLIANAQLAFLAEKLPISRLQRDLTDSTVLRNLGVPFAHQLIALKSIHKGLEKCTLNTEKIQSDLDANWAVITEAIQTILRRENIPNSYDLVKQLSRGKIITKESLWNWIDSLEIAKSVKDELRRISPSSYTGDAMD